MSDPLFPIDALKKCCTCKQTKPLDAFNVLRRSKDGHQPSCRECNAAYHRSHWERHMAQIRERRDRRRAAAKAFIIGYLKAHPCVDCGETDIVVLEFDHLRDKRANVSTLIGRSELWRIEEEIAKCDVVCCNCHRRRTARRGSWYRNDA
jgi:hypothetical protein